MRKIKVLNDELALDGRFIRVYRRHFIGTGGKPAVWEMVRRKTLGRIIAVVAITPEKGFFWKRSSACH